MFDCMQSAFISGILTCSMVTLFGKCTLLCVLAARRRAVDLYKSWILWHVFRHSSTECETKIISQHLPTNRSMFLSLFPPALS